jgi:hypothetical protein
MQFIYLNQRTEVNEGLQGGLEDHHVKLAYRQGVSNHQLFAPAPVFSPDGLIQITFPIDNLREFHSLVEEKRNHTNHSGKLHFK